MFIKHKPVRRDNVRVTQYKKVIDWDAVGGAAIVGVIILALLANCSG